MRKIYIAGPISKDKDFYEKFRKVELKLKSQGNIVLNPAKLPPGLKQQDYMSICIPMLYVCDRIFMLNGWDNSVGACIEHDIAQQSGIEIIYQDLAEITLRERLYEILRKPKEFLQDGEKLILEKNGRKIILFNDGEELSIEEA